MSGTLVLAELPGGLELAAIVEDGRVTDWIWSPDGRAARPETLYKGRIGRPAAGAGALFVDLGGAGQGYLRDRRGVQPGATILVEATGIPEAGKAIPVSPRILYRQRYTIHTPGNTGVNVSRAIRDEEERARLIGIVETHITEMEDWLGRIGASRKPEQAERIGRIIEAHRDGGTILRSAAQGKTAERIIADLDLAVTSRLEAEDHLADASTPLGAIARPAPPHEFALREWGKRIDSISLARDSFHSLESDERQRNSPFQGQIERVQGDPLDHHGVWDAIEQLRQPEAKLPSGGWIAVEPTRAMVTVDVNTGGEFSPAAGLTANIEAMRELPRQLRLRGLGGQVIIDFAPLRKADRRRLEEVLKSAFRRDPVETTLAGWTPLGNFELHRRRERSPITELLSRLNEPGNGTP